MTPDSLEAQHTLATAATRYDELRTQEVLASGAVGSSDDRDALAAGDLSRAVPLTAEEALELLALGEVIARKTASGRQLAVRSAREAGASWSQIGAALGVTKQSAWEAHSRWIDQQVSQRSRIG